MAGATSPASSKASQGYSLSNDLPLNSLEKVDNFLTTAQEKTKVTFWGKRVIIGKIDAFSNIHCDCLLSLNPLAKKMIYVANERCKKDDLTTDERLTGISISKKITKFYETTDRQVKQRNFLTRFFVFLREYSFKSYRNLVNNGLIRKLFSAYSEQNYVETFGREKDGDKYKYELGHFDYRKVSSPRIVVSDDIINDFFSRAKEFLEIS